MSLPPREPRRPPARHAAPAALVLAAALALPAAPARAQEGAVPSMLQGGVPTGEATPNEIALSLAETIERGLRYNLGSILGGSAVASAEGARKEAQADLLPQLRAGVLESRQTINLAAYGLTLPGVPPLVGPFNLFDARVFLHQSILDLKARHRSQAAADTLEAARQDEHGVRDLVVLVCGQLYVQAVAGETRIAATRAQLDTAEALLALARDRKASGLGAGIEVLRAEVQAQSLRQRLIVAEQEAAKEKLALARAIGLPLGQRFRLSDPMPFAPAVPLTVEEAVERAWAGRPDLKAAQARVEAAEKLRQGRAGRGAAVARGDARTTGPSGTTCRARSARTRVGAALRVPLFEGGRVQARVREAEAARRPGARAPRRPARPHLLRGAGGLPRPEGGRGARQRGRGRARSRPRAAAAGEGPLRGRGGRQPRGGAGPGGPRRRRREPHREPLRPQRGPVLPGAGARGRGDELRGAR